MPLTRRLVNELVHFLGISWKYDCLRHGHQLLCNADGHLCVHCGRFWKGIDG